MLPAAPPFPPKRLLLLLLLLLLFPALVPVALSPLCLPLPLVDRRSCLLSLSDELRERLANSEGEGAGLDDVVAFRPALPWAEALDVSEAAGAASAPKIRSLASRYSSALSSILFPFFSPFAPLPGELEPEEAELGVRRKS